MPNDSQDSIDPLTKPYTESATLPYEELDQLKATAGKSLVVHRLHSDPNGGGVSSRVGGASLMTRVLCLFCSRLHAWITSGWTAWRRDAPSRAAAARASSWQTYASHVWHTAKHYTALAQVWNRVILINHNHITLQHKTGCPLKLSRVEPGQYLDERPPGKTRLLLVEVLVRPAGGAHPVVCVGPNAPV